MSEILSDVVVPDDGAPVVSYETNIKPLFRPKDRNNMLSRFDLWSYEDVKEWAQRIYDQVSGGDMPCDGPWPDESITLFDTWMKQGMAP